jgi:neurofibromin 1
MSTIQKHIWAEVAKLDSNIVDIILDELIRAATDGGIGTRRCETISHIVAALSSINVRGRIYSKLRKALSKVPSKPPNTLPEHQNWNEISTLIRLTLVIGQSTQFEQIYLYVPEIIHLVSLVAGDGNSLVRKSVYGIIINLLQSLYISRPEDRTEPEIMRLINDCTLPENLQLFGLRRETPTAEYSNVHCSGEKSSLDKQEKLAQLLLRVMTVTAGSTRHLNVWRVRWMSLITATAFQQSPAIQTRSFVALAVLAVSQVDDDFLYQILVAFKSALSNANESNTAPIISMLRCMCKVVPALVGTSRYIGVLFWLAVALLQGSHASYYAEASSLLQVTLRNMEEQGLFKNNSVQNVLLEAREPLESVTSQLDDMLRLSFESSFSFSLAAIIFKGLRHSTLKGSAEDALRTLLQVTVATYDPNRSLDLITDESLGYFIALLPVSTTPKNFHRLLRESKLDTDGSIDVGISDDDDEDDGSMPRLSAELLNIHDSTTALLVASFVGSILSTAQGDDAEAEILYDLLSSLSLSYPDIISMICEGGIQDRVKDIFANSSNPSIIRSVSNVIRVALQDFSRLSDHGSTSTLLSTVDENPASSSRTQSDALEELGMQGLADSFQFLPPNRGHTTRLLQWIPALVTLMIS